MKKVTVFILTVFLSASLFGCGSSNNQSNNNNGQESETETSSSGNESKETKTISYVTEDGKFEIVEAT